MDPLSLLSLSGLTITNAKPDDGGEFICRAYNGHGDTMETFRVHVVDQLPDGAVTQQPDRPDEVVVVEQRRTTTPYYRPIDPNDGRPDIVVVDMQTTEYYPVCCLFFLFCAGAKRWGGGISSHAVSPANCR